jgi:hypothetical protein
VTSPGAFEGRARGDVLDRDRLRVVDARAAVIVTHPAVDRLGAVVGRRAAVLEMHVEQISRAEVSRGRRAQVLMGIDDDQLLDGRCTLDRRNHHVQRRWPISGRNHNAERCHLFKSRTTNAHNIVGNRQRLPRQEPRDEQEERQPDAHIQPAAQQKARASTVERPCGDACRCRLCGMIHRRSRSTVQPSNIAEQEMAKLRRTHNADVTFRSPIGRNCDCKPPQRFRLDQTATALTAVVLFTYRHRHCICPRPVLDHTTALLQEHTASRQPQRVVDRALQMSEGSALMALPS